MNVSDKIDKTAKANKKVVILVATYNGERYLPEQLDSIFSQSYFSQNCLSQNPGRPIVVIRDDGSTDATLEVIAAYQQRFPERIHVLPADPSCLGPSAGFACLIRYVLDNKQALGLDNPYLMLADQDDYWHPDKVTRQIEAMTVLESRYPGRPLLVHSDLAVVNAEREIIADSYISYQGLDASRNRLGQLLISNIVTGCTACINEALARKAVPVPQGAIMHDWWLGIVAVAFGRTVYVDQALVEYRQHGSNTIGAREHRLEKPSTGWLWRKLQKRPPNQLLVQVSEQARLFLCQYGDELGMGQKAAVRMVMQLGVRHHLLQSLLFRSLRALRI